MKKTNCMRSALLFVILVAAVVNVAASQPTNQPLKNVVLVHGAFADGSGWQKVYTMLKQKGYNVAIVQNPLTSLADDVAATKRVIALMDGPVVLVAHSWGGVVITEAGNDPKVERLVYVAAFAPDAGEPVGAILKNAPADAPQLPAVPSADGFVFFDKARFPAGFCADVDAKTAQFMADSQIPIVGAAFEATVSAAAWKTKPSWYVIPDKDLVISPVLERSMAKRAGSTVVEVKGSHAIYVSQPKVVADLIESAARGK